ncbi:CNT_collapsed_G0036850.mRNA.1.CDS.1 [Saccharomyces cerevisiae]|nr:CNT_collapsed_G0036850.mRNA.1.CDS.1 [Saccharomyces cerevisiae]
MYRAGAAVSHSHVLADGPMEFYIKQCHASSEKSLGRARYDRPLNDRIASGFWTNTKPNANFSRYIQSG